MVVPIFHRDRSLFDTAGVLGSNRRALTPAEKLAVTNRRLNGVAPEPGYFGGTFSEIYLWETLRHVIR